MGQVTYDAITDYAPRDATDINDIMSAFQTASSHVAAANVADEGLDETSLGVDCLTDGRVSITYNSGLADAPNAAGFLVANTYYLINIGAGPTPFSSTNGGAGWAVGQNVGNLRVSFNGYWQYNFPAGVAPLLSPTIKVKLQYRIDGAAGWSDVTGSIYEFQGIRDVWYEPSGAGTWVTVPFWREQMGYEFDIPYPLDGLVHTINEVRVVMASDAIPAAPADFKMNDVSMFIERSIKTVS